MQCAAGELCHLSTCTSKAAGGHQCRGGCGGRLHGICGEVEEGESEMKGVCHTRWSFQQAATAAMGKRKAQEAGCILKRTKAVGGEKADRCAPRTRLSLDRKMEVLPDLHQSAQTWASIEDQKDVVEAQRLDQACGATAAFKGLSVEGWESLNSEEEEEDDEDGSIGGGRAEPPPHTELFKHIGPLENYAAGCGLDEASYLLKRARMLMIEAHASKPSRQTDVRAYFDA